MIMMPYKCSSHRCSSQAVQNSGTPQASSSSAARLRASWVAHSLAGCAVIPRRCTRRVLISMTNAMYRRWSVIAQST